MSKAKIFLASMIWLVLLTVGVLLYRLWVVPSAEKQQAQQQEQLIKDTSGADYKYRIRIGLDSFSGYAVLRSDEFKQQLRSRSIKLTLADDQSDYTQRLAKLQSGELQFAAFPIDALLKTSAASGTSPATIIAIIDETRGADALLAYKSKFPDVNSLNTPDTRFVFVGDSPSETLVRVLTNNFDLTALSDQAFVPVGSEQEVLARYKAAAPGGNEVFVTWEPHVSEIKRNDKLHVLIDTAKQSGYIVDALVVGREFDLKNGELVQQVLESYFRAMYAHSSPNQLVKLVENDAVDAKTRLSDDQASAIAAGILWKNTQENFAHFGLRSASVSHVEDMIDRIKRVLLDTDAIRQDPTGGDSTTLYHDEPLRKLHSSNFHPGVNPEEVREDATVPALTDRQWQELATVGAAQIPPLVYARGTAKLTGSSKTKLDDLVKNLESWPLYYIEIRGNASSRGNAEANRALAKQRADAALQYLLSKGVPANKIRAAEGELSGKMSVTFWVGQRPY